MCTQYEINMNIMCKSATSHLFHIIFILISYFLHVLAPKWWRARPGPAGPGSWPGPCRHFGSKIWKTYELNMETIWNKCALALLHIITIFISHFLHIPRRICFICFAYFLDFAFEAFSIGVATYKFKHWWWLCIWGCELPQGCRDGVFETWWWVLQSMKKEYSGHNQDNINRKIGTTNPRATPKL